MKKRRDLPVPTAESTHQRPLPLKVGSTIRRMYHAIISFHPPKIISANASRTVRSGLSPGAFRPSPSPPSERGCSGPRSQLPSFLPENPGRNSRPQNPKKRNWGEIRVARRPDCLSFPSLRIQSLSFRPSHPKTPWSPPKIRH